MHIWQILILIHVLFFLDDIIKILRSTDSFLIDSQSRRVSDRLISATSSLGSVQNQGTGEEPKIDV